MISEVRLPDVDMSKDSVWSEMSRIQLGPISPETTNSHSIFHGRDGSESFVSAR